MKTTTQSLTETELTKLEITIEQGLTTFIDVGLALARIQTSKAYKTLRNFKTFEAYVKARFKLSRSRSYALIAASKTALHIQKVTGKTPDTAKEAEDIAKELNKLPAKMVNGAIHEYAKGDKKKARSLLSTGRKTLEGVKEVERATNRQKAIEGAKGILDSEDVPFQVVHADFRDFMATMEPASVDLILTDIDYHANKAEYAEPFSSLAKRVLKPESGIAAVMLGNLTFDKFYPGLVTQLPYRGQICYTMPAGKAPTIHADNKRWNPFWKPVLVLGAAPDYVHRDIVEADDCDKPFFYMEQDIGGFKKLIELLIRPGSRDGNAPGMTVLDCCVGTGTTLLAGLFAKSGPFKVIGCDIDAERVELSRARCKVAWSLMQEHRDGDKALAALKEQEAELKLAA